MRIAYIVTMRKGLPAFVYREIKEMNKLDGKAIPYVMVKGKGPYMPSKEWNPRYWSGLSILTGLFFLLLKNPFVFFRNFIDAMQNKTLIDFLIALGFYRNMQKDQVSRILCFEGLHALRIAFYIKKMTGIVYSVIVHAEMLRVTSYLEFTKRALIDCTNIISPTELNCKKISEKFNLPRGKVILNRMSIDTEKFKVDDRFKILIVGFFAARKGHETLLKAINLLKRNDIILWIAGGDVWGGDSFDVTGYIKENNLNEYVKVFGRASDEVIHLLYENCDLFCLPAKTPPSGVVEGLPVALMEAMSYGKPVISTYHTGIPELVEEVLIEENDFENLAKEIIRLKDDNELRAKMGERNRQIIEQRFSNNIGNMMKILKEE